MENCYFQLFQCFRHTGFPAQRPVKQGTSSNAGKRKRQRIIDSDDTDDCEADTGISHCTYCALDDYAPPPEGRALNAMMRVCLVSPSVAYIGHKSKTERPTNTKIGTEVPRSHAILTPSSRSKVKVSRLINDQTENRPINFKIGIRMEHEDRQY